MRVALVSLSAAALLAIAGCGNDDEEENADSPRTEPATTSTTGGGGEAPSAAEVRSIALEEIGSCPKQQVREFLSAGTRKQRGIAESPMLYCDGLPAVWYLRYESPDGFQTDPGRQRDAEIPYFLDGEVLVTAMLTAPGNNLAEKLPARIKQECGCGEVRKP